MRPGHILPPPVDAPSFMAIVTRLDSFLSVPHPPMPGYRFRGDERQTVIAYMLSLRDC
jgi:hypothetical protein